MAKITYAGEIYLIDSELELKEWVTKKTGKTPRSKPRGSIREVSFKLPDADVTVYYSNKVNEFHIDYVKGLREK